LRHFVFPETPALKSMIDAVSQIGILLLLLLTGMETNLALVNRKRRAVHLDIAVRSRCRSFAGCLGLCAAGRADPSTRRGW